MIKQRKSNKLVVTKETLRTLQSQELVRIEGGLMMRTKSCDDMFCANITTV